MSTNTRLKRFGLFALLCALALSVVCAGCEGEEDEDEDEDDEEECGDGEGAGGAACDCGTPTGDGEADAGDGITWSGNELQFADTKILIEINDTDGDSGLQIFLDAEGWEWVDVFDPSGNRVFHVEGGEGVKQTGLTELYFESAEPGFDALPLDEFLERFPAGVYTFEGRSVNADRLVGEATLTHALPEAPLLLSPEENSVVDPADTVVEWEPVADPEGSSIVNYQVIVETEVPSLRVLDAMLPADATRMVVPPEFLTPDTHYKFEVLAIEESGNQTLSESPGFDTPP